MNGERREMLAVKFGIVFAGFLINQMCFVKPTNPGNLFMVL